MVTGDYQHTALAVARGVGMVPPGGPLIIIQSKAELQPRTAQPPTRCRPSAAKTTPQSRGQSFRAGVSISSELGLMVEEPRRHKSALRGFQGLSDGPSVKKKSRFSDRPGRPVQLSLSHSLSERERPPQDSALPERAVPELPALHAAGVLMFLPHQRSSRVAPAPQPVTHSLVSAAAPPASDQFGESTLSRPQRGQLESGAPVEPTTPALSNALLGHMEAHDQSEGQMHQQRPGPVVLPEASTAAAVEGLPQLDRGQVQNESCEGLAFMLQSEGRITWGLDPQHALTQLAQVQVLLLLPLPWTPIPIPPPPRHRPTPALLPHSLVELAQVTPLPPAFPVPSPHVVHMPQPHTLLRKPSWSEAFSQTPSARHERSISTAWAQHGRSMGAAWVQHGRGVGTA